MKAWMPGARRIPTSAKGGYGNDGQMRARAIVTHVMEGWSSTMDLWAMENPVHHRASYHFGIAKNGAITQYVPIDTPAWHAGRLDERNGLVVRPPWKGWLGEGTNPNAYTVGVSREGFSIDPWTDQQKDSLLRIYRFVIDETGIVPSGSTIIGHKDIAPLSRANDPGGKWTAEEYISLLQNETSPPPGGLAQRIALAYRGTWAASTATPTEWVYIIKIPR